MLAIKVTVYTFSHVNYFYGCANCTKIEGRLEKFSAKNPVVSECLRPRGASSGDIIPDYFVAGLCSEPPSFLGKGCKVRLGAALWKLSYD